MARVGNGRWEVTAVAPTSAYENLRDVPLEVSSDELCAVKPVKLHFSRHIHFMLYGQRLRQIVREPWDLIHCWEEPFNAAGMQAAWWAPKKVPFVFYTFQNIQKRYPPPFSQFEAYTLNRSAGWVAGGELVLETMLNRGYGSKPYQVMPLGVDVETFSPNASSRKRIHEDLGWEMDGPPVVGFLGRFVEHKGLRILTNALERLRSPWRALFVGGGPMELELKEWAKRYSDSVRVVTGIKHDEVPAYLNSMDLLCAPSQTRPNWREQLGRMIIEAFACGTPVLASDSGEIPYVVGDAGRIVHETDEVGWGDTIERLIQSPKELREMSWKGLERARQVYSWAVVAGNYLKFFEQILDSSNKAGNN